MKILQEIFDRDNLLQSTPPLLGSNYCFSPGKNPAFSGYRVVHQEVHLIEAPLYLVRKYFLVNDITKDIPVQITISLAWDGFKSALDFLFGFTEALDLFFNPDKVIDTRAFSLGDFGVAWGWVSEELDVLAFIRNNVFVGIQGFLPKETMISAAKSIDGQIHGLSTTSYYFDDQPGFFSQIRGRNGDLSMNSRGTAGYRPSTARP